MPVLSGLDLSGLPVFLQFSLFLPFRSFASALSLPGLLPWKFPCGFFLQGLGSRIRDGELLIIPDFACRAFRIRACSCSLLSYITLTVGNRGALASLGAVIRDLL